MKHVAIVGAGPSGLFLAILLKRQMPGARIEVYEQNPRDATFGFGIILAGTGMNRIRAADAETADAIAAESYLTRNRVFSHRGESVYIDGGPDGHAVRRLRLLDALAGICERLAVPVHYGTRIDNPDQFGADLVVGADGVNSVVRRAYDGEFGTSTWTLTNRLAWYGTNRHFPQPILNFKTTEHGHFWTAAYPHSETMSTFVAECDAAAWVRSGMYRMDDEQRRLLAQQIFAEELQGHELLTNKSNWISLPVTRCKHWFVGNKVLIGDALHSPHPSIGSGTLIAMEDAIGLAKAIAAHPADTAAACAHYQREHEPYSNKLVHAAEKSFTWYEDVSEKLETLDVVDLAFDYMTRTGRINADRLRTEYPAFMRDHGARWNEWVATRSEMPLKTLQPAPV